MRFCTILIFSFVISFSAFAQLDSLVESLNESIEEDNGLAEIFEDLQQNPFNINSVDREELRIFPFLKAIHIDSIISNRPFSKKRQVRQILDKETYRLIRPFFVVKPVPRLFSIQLTQRNYLPMYKVKGIRENKFLGNEFDNYSRLRFRYSNSIRGGLLIQKDLGEKEYYDHYAGFLQWQNPDFKVIIGNYKIKFGHGLIFDSPYALQKSIFTLAPLHTGSTGGRYHLSASEFSGFNGIFIHYSPMFNLSINAFYTNTIRDGNFDDSHKFVTGLNTSGYHRTDNEYEKKDLIREKTIGANLNYTIFEKSEVGFCIAKTNYNPALIYNEITKTEKDLRRNYFQFTGDQINLFSLFLHSHFESFEFSSEISTNQFEHYSHSHSILMPTTAGGIGFKWWHISKQFQSPFGHSFATGSNFPQAKQGFYIGLKHRLTEYINCSSYWATEKDLWRTYFNPMPTTGKDFLFNLNLKLVKKTDLFFRFQFSDNNYYDSDFPDAFSVYRRKFRLEFIKHISKNIRVRSRVEKVFINYSDYLNKQQGINLYQDISWQVSSLLQIQARFSSFSTDDYNSRIYEFENDLPGTFSNYVLNGQGTKWYLLMRINIFENIRFWIKYRTIYYDGVETIGNGDLQSQGNTRNDMRIQFNYLY